MLTVPRKMDAVFPASVQKDASPVGIIKWSQRYTLPLNLFAASQSWQILPAGIVTTTYGCRRGDIRRKVQV